MTWAEDHELTRQEQINIAALEAASRVSSEGQTSIHVLRKAHHFAKFISTGEFH